MDRATRHTQIRRTDGISLLETVSTMALLAVVSAIAVPSFKNLGDQYRLVSAANQIAYDIGWARMQAIGQHASMRLRLVDNSSYVRERSTDGGTTWSQVQPSSPLPSGVRISAGSGGPTFDRNGIASATATITVSNGRGTKSVVTNVLGRVTLSAGGG
jgi:Tfp pilus assembly protein FimT